MESPNLHRRGFMCVLSSPSGAGKTTLSRQILQHDESLEMSISVTTRPMRPGEEEGVDYYFINEQEFNHRRDAGLFLEHAKVFGHYYGTPKDKVYGLLNEGVDVLFDIDWQGTDQLTAKAKDDVVTIFILPPSMEELAKRLRTRAQDSAEVIANRMAKSKDEISHWSSYDYIIINDDLEQSLHAIRSIIEAERVKRVRQQGLTAFVRTLIEHHGS